LKDRSPKATVVTLVSAVITPAARNRETLSLAGKSSIATFRAIQRKYPQQQ
jgi:hypothetical protein